METTLYLTRHGETEWNVEGRLQGHQDSPLTELGKRQASWLGKSLEDVHFDAIYSSSSTRAYRTAEIIRGQRELDIIGCDQLREIHLGLWEGQKRIDLENAHFGAYHSFWNMPHSFTPMNEGESFVQLQERIIPALEEIVSRHQGGNILIVTHAIALKVIMAYLRGDTLDKLWSPPIIHPTALNKVVFADAGCTIALHGDTSHYQTVRKAVGAIAYHGDKVILVHKVLNTNENHTDVWDVPKGGVEDCDVSLEDAVLRELFEETGSDKYVIREELPEKIEFTFGEYLKKKTGYERQETTMFLVEFIGHPDELEPCDQEISEVKLVDASDLRSTLTHQETALYVEWQADFFSKYGMEIVKAQ